MNKQKSNKKTLFNVPLVLLLLLCIIQSSIATAGATSTQILPTADTYVDENQPDVNYGTVTSLFVQHYTSSYLNYDEQAYFTFDLSQLSCNNQIQFAIYTFASATLTLELHQVTDTNWQETNLTWNDKPNYANTILDSQPVQDNKYTVFNITTIAKQNQNAKLSFVVLTNTASSSSAWIYSKENQINGKPFDAPYVSCVSDVGQTPTTTPGLTILFAGLSVSLIAIYRKIRKS